METTTPRTTYTKLRDGSWGLRLAGVPAANPGMHVMVTKRDGSQKSEYVGRVVWAGESVWLATIGTGDMRSPRRSAAGTSRYCKSPVRCAEALSWDAPDRLCRACERFHNDD